MKTEILNHKTKILKTTGYSEEKFMKTYELITSKIRFVDEILLPDNSIKRALKLTHDIDENDTLFVALTNHVKGKLWTGDKKLENGLKNKNYKRIITTQELYELFIKKKLALKRKI